MSPKTQQMVELYEMLPEQEQELVNLKRSRDLCLRGILTLQKLPPMNA